MNRFSKTLNEKNGLWANIHAKRKRGEKPNPPGHPDRPTAQDFKDAQSTSKKEGYESKGKSVKELRKKKVEVTTDSKIKTDNSNSTETTVSEGPKSPGVGWMLKADPKLGDAVKAKKDINKKREASYGKPSAGVSVPRTPKNDYDRKVDSYLKKKYNKEEVEQIDETPKVDQGLSGKQKVAARAERGDNHRPFEIGNTTGGQWRGRSDPSPYKDSKVAKSGERKGLITKSAIQKTKDVIKSRLNKEEVELEEDMKSAAKEMHGYASKHGGMDKADFHKAAKHMEAGNHKALHSLVKKLDSDPRDKILTTLHKHGNDIKRYGYSTESVEQVDELSQNTLRQYHGKAALDFRKKRDQLSKGTLSTADHKKGQNRLQGLNRAANKMESVEESDAAYAAGQAKDREQQAKAKLNPNDAKKLDKLRALMAREKK